MVSWFFRHPAIRFFFSREESLSAPPDRLARLWIELLAVSFLWGWVCVGVWHGSQWLFGQSVRLSFLPNLLTAVMLLMVLYHRATICLVCLFSRNQIARTAILAAGLAMLFVAGMLVMEPGWYFQEQFLPGWLAWVRPESKIDRLLLLLPLWGAWSMLILPQFQRPDSEHVFASAIARGCGPFTAAAIMGALLAATIGYFAYLPWTQLTIPVVGILTAVIGGLTLARRNGAMDRSVLLATNLLTQLAVLLAVAVNNAAR